MRGHGVGQGAIAVENKGLGHGDGFITTPKEFPVLSGFGVVRDMAKSILPWRTPVWMHCVVMGAALTLSLRVQAADGDDDPWATPAPKPAKKTVRIAAPVELKAQPDEQPYHRWFVGLGVGFGGGYAKGDGLEAFNQYTRGFTPGFSPQGLGHALPEIGYMVAPQVAVSLQVRHQVIQKDNGYMAGGATSVLLRGRYDFGDGPARFYGFGAIGGGEGVRMVVTADTSSGNQIKDTVRGGPVVVGGGLGASYAFGSVVDGVIETGTLVGVPQISAAFDLNFGVRFRF